MMSDLLIGVLWAMYRSQTLVRTSTARGPALRLLCCCCLSCHNGGPNPSLRCARLNHPSDLTCSNKVENANDTAVCQDVSAPPPPYASICTHHDDHLAVWVGWAPSRFLPSDLGSASGSRTSRACRCESPGLPSTTNTAAGLIGCCRQACAGARSRQRIELLAYKYLSEGPVSLWREHAVNLVSLSP